MGTHNVKWKVSLNNGSTFYEDKGIFTEVENELSPYNKLLEYLKSNDLSITSISLFTDDGKTFQLPSLGKNPKFKAFDNPLKPYKYALERKYSYDIGEIDKADRFTTIAAFYRLDNLELKLSVWVDENNTNNSWSLLEVIDG